MTLHKVPLLVMGICSGLALGYIDVLIDHASEPRRPYLQEPVTDAEHHPGLLLLHDIHGESPVSLNGQA